MSEENKKEQAAVRKFETGATRDADTGKLDFEGFLSPRVLQAFGEYMHKHRHQSDGTLRASDNWQKGIPKEVYLKSAWRHFFDWWCNHRGVKAREPIVEALCGLLFNVMGYLHEFLKEQVDTVRKPGVSLHDPRTCQCLDCCAERVKVRLHNAYCECAFCASTRRAIQVRATATMPVAAAEFPHGVTCQCAACRTHRCDRASAAIQKGEL